LVQSVLIFAFGFLAAAFIALAVGPAIWRRAADLTRKRIEASLPLTLNELQADKDQLRAEFAMALSKAHSKSKALQDKITEQMADVGANRERVRVLNGERDFLEAKAQGLEADLASTQSELSGRIADIEALTDNGLQQEAQISDLSNALGLRERVIEALRVDLDNYRIELAANATEREQLNGKISELNANRRALDARLREAATEYRVARESQRSSDRRASEAEKRAEKLASQLADREERLGRREAELAKLKDEIKVVNLTRTRFEQAVQTLDRQRLTLEKQNGRLEERVQKLSAAGEPAMTEKTMKKLEDDKARLLSMVERLTHEKNDLVAQLKAAKDASGDVALRDKVHDLAAKVVAITAENEGQGSPVTKLLKTANEGSAPAMDSEVQGSLANRIRAVQNAARRGA
jgi:chromosome segregation ATPase